MKTAVIALSVGLSIGVLIFFISNKGDETQGNNVSIEDGVQVITIRARGGYSPRLTQAQANIPTVIKVETRGTFDCSSALTIPQMNYFQNLPSRGVTDIEIPPQKAGAKIQGLCAMGMFNFVIQFT